MGHEQRQQAEDNPVAMTAASNTATSAAGDGRDNDTAADAAGDCITGLLCHICNVLIDLVAPCTRQKGTTTVPLNGASSMHRQQDLL